VQLGLENKKKTMWAAVLGVVAVLVIVYEVAPMFLGSGGVPDSSAQAAAPIVQRVIATRNNTKPAKKSRIDSLDPTLRLDLLASSEQTQYEGNGRNIFVSQADPPKIPVPLAKGNTDAQGQADTYRLPPPPAPTPIPLKFFGFASKVGEPKKIFLSQGEDVWVAGEGEIVNRRYKVVHISPNAVEMQDMVFSGPPQNIPLTPG
jgi:hypothetical protein